MIRRRPCKLMNSDDMTSNNTQWGNGVTNTISATEEGWELCSPDLFHYYDHPLMASFFVLAHTCDMKYTTLRTCQVQGRTVSDGTKSGAKVLTTGNKITLPIITTEQRVEIAIRVSLLMGQSEKYVAWAFKWLDDIDRSWDAARAVVYETHSDACETTRVIDYTISTAAYRAASAAWFAVDTICTAFDVIIEAARAVTVVAREGVSGRDILDIIYQVVNKEEK